MEAGSVDGESVPCVGKVWCVSAWDDSWLDGVMTRWDGVDFMDLGVFLEEKVSRPEMPDYTGVVAL